MKKGIPLLGSSNAHAVATNVLADLQRSTWYEEEGCPEITDLACWS